MKFYQIEDLNSGKWYKRGSFGGNWVAQDEASVWTTSRGPSSCLGNITHHNKRQQESWRKKRVPREPEIRVIDTDEAMQVLRELETWGLDTLLHSYYSDEGMERWAGVVARIRKVLS